MTPVKPRGIPIIYSKDTMIVISCTGHRLATGIEVGAGHTANMAAVVKATRWVTSHKG